MQKLCLLAAHDPWLIQLLRMYAEEGGYSVLQAFESEDVLPLAEEQQPEFIILQLDLTGSLRAQDVHHAVRAHPSIRRTTMIVVTGQVLPEELDDEVTFFLQGPVSYDSFLDVLAKAGIQPSRSSHAGSHPVMGKEAVTSGRRKLKK